LLITDFIRSLQGNISELAFRLIGCFENDVLKNMHLPEMKERVDGVNFRVRRPC
jgi:hypothetical protein